MRIPSLVLTAAFVSLTGAQVLHNDPQEHQQQQQKPLLNQQTPGPDSEEQQSPLQNVQSVLLEWLGKAKTYVPPSVVEFGHEILGGDGSRSGESSAPSAGDASPGSGHGSGSGSGSEATPERAEEVKKPVHFTPPPPPKPKRVHRVTSSNWQKLWAPVAVEKGKDAQDVEPEKLEWLVLVTGGNSTCFGGCKRLNSAWKASIPLFTADPTSPSLGVLDCEDQKWLCTMWHALPSTLWHIQLPTTEVNPPETIDNNEIEIAPHVGRPPTKFSHVPMNRTTVTPEAIYDVHSSRQWERSVEPYDGYFHPYDSWLALSGLSPLIASILYVGGKIPSWLVLVIISSFSRFAAWRSSNTRRAREVGANPGTAVPQ